MNKNIVLVSLAAIMIFSGFALGSGNVNTFVRINEEKPLTINGNDADIPIWSNGDSWTYDIQVKGHFGTSTNFDLDIENFKLQVVEVQSDQYKLSLSVPRGDITGGGTVDFDLLQISGSLINTKIDGTFYVRKDILALANTELEIDGYVDKIVDIPFTVAMSTNFYDDTLNQTNFSSLKFPLNIGDIWISRGTYIISDMLVSLLPDPSVLYFYINMHSKECVGWETVEIGSNSYDALKISGAFGDKNDLWYSPAVGNIVKLDYEYIDLSYGYILDELQINLVSTTYEADSDPPSKPDTPAGETELEVGGSGTYSSSATDPDGDIIKLIFDWGDGTKSCSDFIDSGGSAEIEHTWTLKGTHQVKVKARDKYGIESTWSDPLDVTVTNNAPEKPSTPEGPTSGKIKNTYSYSSSTTDSDGHKIYYNFDWGDGSSSGWLGPFNSGESATASHKWTSQGAFQIKVKARDEYNEESDWSDPLSISMPKDKSRNSVLLKIIKKISEILKTMLDNIPLSIIDKFV